MNLSGSAPNRLQALRRLLESEKSSTQDELREELEKLSFEVNQSTISRDLRKLGAIKLIDASGRTVYRLAEVVAPEMAPVVTGPLQNLVTQVAHNGSLVVLHTSPGSASLVARQLDRLGNKNILGTLAGDDTVFVAPAQVRQIDRLTARIRKLFG